MGSIVTGRRAALEKVEEDMRRGEEWGTGVQGPWGTRILCLLSCRGRGLEAGTGGGGEAKISPGDTPRATHQRGARTCLCLPSGTPRRNTEDHIPKGDASRISAGRLAMGPNLSFKTF